jgi:hypothetical protein
VESDPSPSSDLPWWAILLITIGILILIAVAGTLCTISALIIRRRCCTDSRGDSNYVELEAPE